MQFSFAKGRFAACCLLLGAACAAGFALGAALSARPSAGRPRRPASAFFPQPSLSRRRRKASPCPSAWSA